MELNISLGQIDVALGEPETNLEKVRVLAAQAAQRGSHFLVLPELWSTGYDLEHAGRYATKTDEGVFAAVAELARQHGLYILGSCLSLLGEGQYGNTAVLFNPMGQALGSYSKIHLFRLMEEEQYLTAGDELTLVETAWGPVGLTICYDLRFPEQFRAYALDGARLIFVPSEWPHPRLAHWRTLLRARAIENQLYVVACNRVGTSKGTGFFGHSCIVDPWGETVIEGGEGELLLTATINTARVAAVRERIPIFADRRPEVYGERRQVAESFT
jgi:predicted amidohydrolase